MHDGPVWSVAVAPDGKTFATGGSDSTVRIWSLPEEGATKAAPLFALRLSDAPIWAVAFSREDAHTILAFAGADADVRILNVDRLNALFDDPPQLEQQAQDESGLVITAGPDFRIAAAPLPSRSK
jgi:WD40 repeat protein